MKTAVGSADDSSDQTRTPVSANARLKNSRERSPRVKVFCEFEIDPYHKQQLEQKLLRSWFFPQNAS